MRSHLLRILASVAVAASAAVLPASAPEVNAQASGATKFVSVSPFRLVDSRDGTGTTRSPLTAGTERTLQVTGRGGVPTAATAVVVNLTAVGARSTGALHLYPAGGLPSGTTPSSHATLYVDRIGQTQPVAAVLPLGAGGRLSVYSNGLTADILVDVFGYFTPAATSKDGRLVAVTPARTLDTRSGDGLRPPNPGDTKNCSDFRTYVESKQWFDFYFPAWGDIAKLDRDGNGLPCETLPGVGASVPRIKVPATTTLTLQVTGRGGVPAAGVGAVVMNVTAVDPTSDGWIQVAPTPVRVGASSNLNPAAGATIPNLVIVPVSRAGTVDLYTFSETHLLADVVGYFTDTTATDSSAGLFVPKLVYNLKPAASQTGGATATFTAAALSNDATAVVGNLFATNARGGGWVQLAPRPIRVGAASNLNTVGDRSNIANAVISPTGTGNSLQVYTFADATIGLHATGWFTKAGTATNPSTSSTTTTTTQPAPTTTTTTVPPTTVAPTGSTALTQLAGLTVRTGTTNITYDRDEWHPSWTDADGDCINARHEVLIIESQIPVTMASNGCTVTAGRWLDPFTGQTFTNPSQLDIDHMVPLADAHRSGGAAWTTSKKRTYSNDLTNPETLIAVSASANRSKSDRSPDQWLPTNTAYHCTYVTEWVDVKHTWQLSVTAAEKTVLRTILEGC